VRFWRDVTALKRGGRAHIFGEITTTLSEGELALECPACPHVGKNMAEDRPVGPHNRFVSITSLAFSYPIFRLKVIEYAIHCYGRQLQIEVEESQHQG
jgi:hypothetical protein